MSAKWQRIRVSVPDDLTKKQRLAVAADVIEHIRLRTESGKDKNGKKFPRYSKEYIQSLDFKNAGKSKNKVNLTLSGDMLIALDLISDKKGSILIGYENGSEENAKADGNINGTYGQKSPIPGKKRDFLGIKKSKVNEIVRDVKGRDFIDPKVILSLLKKDEDN